MAARRLLLVDSSCLSAHRWHLSGLVEEARFAHDAAGRQGFRAYVDHHADSIFCLLADVTDEVFQIEDIPHVHGRDRREIITRKLAQHFLGSPLTLAVSRGRLPAGRRDERVLLAGLTRPELIEPWLSALREGRCRLQGVFSLPQIIAALHARLAAASAADGSELVISVGRAGVRQTFFADGQLRLSRLSPFGASGIGGTGGLGDIAEIAAVCAVEAGKMFQYLAAQRLIDRGQPLSTRILAHPAQFEAFRARCGDTPENRFELVDLAALARELGMATPPADSAGDDLFLHALACHPPAQQFAPEADRRFFRLGQARFAIHTAAAAIFGACLLFAAARAFTWHEVATDNRATEVDIELAKRRYQSLLDGLPKTALSVDQVRALTDRHAVLAKRGQSLEPMLRHISRALAQAPAVELMELDWRLVNQYREGDADDKADGRLPAAAVPAVPESPDGYVVVRLQAQLPLAMIGDHRAQLAAVDAFVAALASRDIQAQVLTLPFEAASGKLLRSSDTNGLADPPRFSLRLVSRP